MVGCVGREEIFATIDWIDGNGCYEITEGEKKTKEKLGELSSCDGCSARETKPTPVCVPRPGNQIGQ